MKIALSGPRSPPVSQSEPMARVWMTVEMLSRPLTGKPKRMPRLAIQAKCSPQPSQSRGCAARRSRAAGPKRMVMTVEPRLRRR